MNDRLSWMRTALFGASGGIVVVLLAAASTPVAPEPAGPKAPEQIVKARVIAPVVVETSRLRGRRSGAGARIVVQRNLFVFSSTSAATAPADAARGMSAPVAEAPVAQPVAVRLSWQLIGIASDDAFAGGRMAILSGPGALQFVRAGELLPEGLRVAAVGDESVELRADDDRPVILTLPK